MFGADDLAIAGLVLGGVSSIANFGLGLANYDYQKIYNDQYLILKTRQLLAESRI